MGAVKRTHPRAVKWQKMIKKKRKMSLQKRKMADHIVKLLSEAFWSDMDKFFGVDMASEQDQTGFVDRSMFPEFVWKKLRVAHDERD